MFESADVLERERRRRALGEQLLADLGVLPAWSAIGNADLEGAMALQLVVSRDIDVEVVAHELDLSRIVDVWLQLRRHPAVVRGSVIERPEPPFEGVYCLLVARDRSGQDWSVETWVFPTSRTAPRGLDAVRSLIPRLDPATRVAVLTLKEEVHRRPEGKQIPSSRIYEAVLDHGIVEIGDLVRWIEATDA